MQYHIPMIVITEKRIQYMVIVAAIVFLNATNVITFLITEGKNLKIKIPLSTGTN